MRATRQGATVNQGRIILIGGGARSGKSDFALELARGLGTRRLFVATAQPFDDEMRERIQRHRAERGNEFQTIEEPLELARVFASPQADVILVDCLTLWLSNLLLAGHPPAHIEERVRELAGALGKRKCHAILVTNEVGMGIVPENALARTFRDVVGRAHRELARVADDVYFAVLGMMVKIKPELTAVTL
ncbi:MAG: bifunctional adenosylcobinamide kinase/adenosylcobinamide-phosphate guanylyltransferase [Gemmataceae bacterium]